MVMMVFMIVMMFVIMMVFVIMMMFVLMAPLLIFFFAAIGICMINDKRRDRKLAKLAQGSDEASLNTATSAEDLAKMGYFEEEKTS